MALSPCGATECTNITALRRKGGGGIEIYREDEHGELLVRKGKVWHLFDYGASLWLSRSASTDLEILIRRKGYARGDHEARGLVLSSVLEWVLPRIREGSLVIEVEPGEKRERGRFVGFTCDKTDYLALQEVFRAFPVLRRDFVSDRIFRLALKEVSEKVDERRR